MGRNQQYEGVRIATESSIEIDFYYAGKRCKERVKCEPTPANLKKMAQFRAAVLLAISNGTFDYAVSFPNSKRAAAFAKAEAPCPAGYGLTVGAHLDAWIDRKAADLAASTVSGYKKAINAVLRPKLGSILLSELSLADVKNAVKDLDVTNKWLTNIQSVLRSALNDAVEDELIESNPIINYTFRRSAKKAKKSTRSKVDPFTKDEQAAIIAATSDQIRNLVTFAFWTGLRPGELIALLWSDIDWQRGVVHVTKSISEAAEEPELPKTEAGLREVKLLPPALQALKDQRAYTLTKGQEVFQNPKTQKPWKGNQAFRRNYWAPALDKAGVRYRNPYQTRHTFASMMLTAKEHPMWVAKQMGHEDLGMIQRVYGKFIEDENLDTGALAVQQFASQSA